MQKSRVDLSLTLVFTREKTAEGGVGNRLEDIQRSFRDCYCQDQEIQEQM